MSKVSYHGATRVSPGMACKAAPPSRGSNQTFMQPHAQDATQAGFMEDTAYEDEPPAEKGAVPYRWSSTAVAAAATVCILVGMCVPTLFSRTPVAIKAPVTLKAPTALKTPVVLKAEDMSSDFFSWRERTCSPSPSAQKSFFERPVYVSLTTTSYRVAGVHEVIKSILCQQQPPHRVMLYVSDHQFHKDAGVSEDDLIHVKPLLASKALKIQWVPNWGPHRKLIFLLRDYRDDDVLLVTIDDDYVLRSTWLGDMLSCHLQQPNATISGRINKICARNQQCHGPPFARYGTRCLSSTVLDLPTGVNGILYRPAFFHPVVYNRPYLLAAEFGDDISFRFATHLNHNSVSYCPMRKVESGLRPRRNISSKLWGLDAPLSAFNTHPNKTATNDKALLATYHYVSRHLGAHAKMLFRPAMCAEVHKQPGTEQPATRRPAEFVPAGNTHIATNKGSSRKRSTL